MSETAQLQLSALPDEADLQSEGRCHAVVGVWGSGQCSQLAAHGHCHNCPVYAQTGRRLLDRAPSEGAWLPGDASAGISDETSGNSLIVFRVGSEWLGLPTLMAREILNPLPAHRVPHRRDPRFLGIVNVRGELLPCVQLEAMLGIRPASAELRDTASAARLIIIERERAAWATPVDAVDGIRRVRDDALLSSPVTVELASSRFTRAVIELPVGRVGLIDEELLWRALDGVCR